MCGSGSCSPPPSAGATTTVEYEHYTDSAGKSGGQKEKLAYTILAASLAYQFKLDWGAERSKAFRFVVIDEAFSRGSELSTRYALEPVHPTRPAAADRDPAAEDPRDRTTRRGGRFRRQPQRQLFTAAVPHHRRVPSPPPRPRRWRAGSRACGAGSGGARSSTRTWTGVEQLVSTLQKRWDTGRYLRAHAAGDKWAPITLPVKGPSAEDLLDHFDEARKWTAEFERDAGCRRHRVRAIFR